MTGAERLVATLADLGVELAFGLPGVHNLAIWRALAGSPIRLVGVRHEQSAAYAADGYARTTGRLGVALVTTGPGAANTLGATGEAMASGSPVLVIATDIPAALRRPGVYRGVLHETRDQGAMFGPVTKHAGTVGSAHEIAAAVREAAALALRAPSGPVYLGIPTDLLAHEAGAEPAVAALAAHLAAPVITTYMGRGLIAPDHPCAVPGPVHEPSVGALWDEADVVLAIGTDFDGMMTQNWTLPRPPALIAINVDPGDANKNYACDVTLIGDARELTERLAAALAARRSPAPLEPLADRLHAVTVTDAVGAAVRADEPEAERFLSAMERVLPDEAVVVADMCIPGYWLGGYRRVPLPRTFAYPVGWGTLGFGFLASLGAALAGVGPTVCVTGDGGFMFACGELATVVQERIPLTVVLVDDGGYGMLRFDQRHGGEAPFGVDLARPDFAALAAAFGIAPVAVNGFGEGFARARGRRRGRRCRG